LTSSSVLKPQLASGQFKSEDEVLREAMATLESRQRGLEQLRRMVGEAEDEIVAGRVGLFDAEENKRAVRERLSRQGVVE
jgi:Arc/MetJ-type ribon-helix-helix transcriptional regulator